MPEEDESQEPESLEEHAQMAQQLHAQLDQMKEWSLKQSSDLRSRAELAEEHDLDLENSPDEIREVADFVEGIYERIEGGDRQKSRNG